MRKYFLGKQKEFWNQLGVFDFQEEQNTEPELKKQQLNRPQISRRRTLAEEMYELEL